MTGMVWVVSSGRGLYHKYDSAWTSKEDAEARVAALPCAWVDLCLPLDSEDLLVWREGRLP